MKSLVVFYSRSNITRKLAEDIAEKLEADIEIIVPHVNYKGKMGYMRGVKDGARGKVISIDPPKFNPRAFDVIYLGAPVWASRAANPIISYIDQNREKFNDVKFFLTAGSSGFESGFKQMEEVCGKKPLKTLALTTKEVKSGNYDLESFIS